MQIGVTGTRTPTFTSTWPGPGLGHRHVPELARLLPFDELEGLDGAASVCDPVELDLEMQWAAEDLVLPVGRRIDDQARILDAAQEILQRQVDLQAASGPPTQLCTPRPQPTCWLSGRWMSNFSGSGNRFGSRFAAPYSRCTAEPFGMTVPPISMSAVTLRLGKN